MVILCLTCWATAQIATAAVELVIFKGEFSGSPATVKLIWESSYESRTAGYFIKRKISGSDDTAVTIPVMLNGTETSFIPAAGDGTTGADYLVSDNSITVGNTYEYSLWERKLDGEPSEPLKSFMIEATATSVSTELEIVSDTAEPSSTNTPVATAQATTSGTATLTATPSTTVTAATTTAATTTPTAATTAAITAAITAENSEAVTASATTSQPTTSQPTVPLTATPITEESAPIEIISVAEAAEPNQEDTYPDPSQETGENGQDYVPPITNTPPPINEENVRPIGEGIELPEDQPGQAVEQVDTNETSQSRFILWGGFLSSLLFFVAVVIGTVLMYQQRKPSG